MTPREKGKFIVDKIAMFPYAIVKNNPNKKIRVLMFLLSFFTLVIIMTPLIPYFLYIMVYEIFLDV